MNASLAPSPPLATLTHRLAILPWAGKLNLLLLTAFVLALTGLLWPHWRDDPDLSHGYLMLPLFFLLLHESRAGTQRFLPASRTTTAAVGLLLALGLLAVCTGGLYAAALDWSHALVAFVLTVSLVLLLGAALVAFSTRGAALTPFNWPAVVAIGLWLLSAPIPPGSYTRLTIALQLAISEGVLRTLQFIGIAAARHGNIIELGTATVGVEDACSGVRSLISCIYAGFFFSATLVRRPWHRVLIVALAGPLAVAMNYLRSLTLTLLANGGVDISGRWHDLTGFAVLGVTAVLLGGFAVVLERREPPAPAAPAPAPAPAAGRRPGAGQRLLSAGLVLVAGFAILLYLNTRPSIRRTAPVPNLAATLPDSAAGWQVDTARDLYQFRDTLKTDHLAQRTYLRPRADGVEQITIYLAYWSAGQAPVSLVSMHTPDACWPGSGWSPAGHTPPRQRLALPGRTLPPAESRFFTNDDGYPQYVWFWHLYDGHPITQGNPRSARALLDIAWRYGFTHDGDQLFVRVSSNRPWSQIAGAAPVKEFFAHIQSLGL